MKNQKPLTGLENQLDFTKHAYITHVPIYSAILIFGTQTSEIHLHYPLVVSHDHPPIALRKCKRICTSHSLALYLIHTCLSFLSYLNFFFRLIFCSQVYIKNPIYPKLEGCHERRNDGLEQNEI